MSMKWILTILLTGFCASFAADDDPLAALRQLAGDWELTFVQVDDSGEYREVGTSTSHIEIKLGGKLVQEETLIKTAKLEFPLLVNYSYDRARQVFRKASIDGVTGLMDIQEGAMADGVLYLANTKYQTWFVNSSGRDIAFRISFDLSRPAHPVMVADVSTDYGRTWHKFQKVFYSRVEPEVGGASQAGLLRE